jgi:hypothetical protein
MLKIPKLRVPLTLPVLTSALLVASVAAWTRVGETELDMGTTNLGAGVTKVEDIPYQGINDNDAIVGVACNQTGRDITDLTLVIPGTAPGGVGLGKVKLTPVPSSGNPQTATADWRADGSAKVNFTSPVPVNACFKYQIEGIQSSGNPATPPFTLLPSYDRPIGGTQVHIDLIGVFETDALENLKRKATGYLQNAAVAAILKNADPLRSITGIDGALASIGSPNAAILGVDVLTPSGFPLSGVQATINGLSFHLTVPALAPGVEVDVIVRLSGDIQGRPLRFDLEATHAP